MKKKRKNSKKVKGRGNGKVKSRTLPRRSPKPVNGEMLDMELSGPKPAPKNGPGLNLRLRDGDAVSRIKGAAKKAGLSMNTWVCEVLDKAAGAQA